MTPMQQIFLGVGASKKTYVDDVFSTFLYEGTGSAVSVNNGIDLSGEGGMTWIKSRTNTQYHNLIDTVRGATKAIFSNHTMAEDTATNGYMTSFNNNGFTTGTYNNVTDNNQDFASWSFRKAKGFFDVITYTGDPSSSTRQMSHNLGCVPGLILIKSTTYSDSTYGAWSVYHRNMHPTTPEDYVLRLNTTDARADDTDWGDTKPTATHFTLGTQWEVNKAGESYVAYLFAGGDSTAATARSVDFDGSGDRLTLAASTDFAFGTGDFTVECWAKPVYITAQGVWQISGTSGGLDNDPRLAVSFGSDGKFRCVGPAGDQWVCGKYEKEQWYHIARVRASGVSKLYINGTEVKSFADTTDYTYQNLCINGYYSTSYLLEGAISNFRVVKGTAVYTSSFRPPTEPLTNITNTKLLCCNGSSTTSSTVTPGTITANGNPTASTDSPFDDPAAFNFGDNKEGIVKCGRYIGNGSSTGPEINLGFEPQWILHKSSSVSGTAWHVFDCMKGVVSGGADAILVPNTTAAEASDSIIDITSTGFRITTSAGGLNQDDGEYIYCAIRRPDGYVGKPVDAGTDVFDMKVAQTGGSTPYYQGYGFVVDSIINKNPDGTGDFSVHQRLTGKGRLETNTTNAEATNNNALWDYMNGFNAYTGNSGYVLSWGWKRHAGMDVVAYKGNGAAGHQIPHSLNKTVDMMWIKKRDATDDWWVYHSGMVDNSGGGDPEDYAINLNKDTARTTSASAYWNGTAPTSTHFTLGSSDDVNQTGYQYLAMLFSSVDKISKAGYYDGSNSSQTITLGFQPRFLMVRNMGSTGGWYVIDSSRGTGSSGSKMLTLNTNNAQFNMTSSYFTFISTGFTITGTNQNWNAGGSSASNKYLYYAHA